MVYIVLTALLNHFKFKMVILVCNTIALPHYLKKDFNGQIIHFVNNENILTTKKWKYVTCSIKLLKTFTDFFRCTIPSVLTTVLTVWIIRIYRE